MRQLDAELRRFFARRMVRGTFLLAALLIVIVVSITTAKGHKDSGEFAGPLVRDPATGRISQQYGDSGTFTLETNDTRINVATSLESAIEGTGVALLFAGFALGASFVGAEFNVGSLTSQLLFEPRRGRVHSAKAAGVGIGIGAVAFAVLALVAIAMYIGSALHGVLAGVDGTFVVHRLSEALRVSAAAGLGGAMAYAVTLVAKRSSAGMIVFFLQYPLLFLLDPNKKPFGVVSHYLPLRGLLAIVVDPATATGVNERTIHTMAGGVVLTLVWVVVIVGLSGVAFARAEVR